VIPRDVQTVLVAIPAIIGWYIALFVLGAVTGIYGMCQTASEEWAQTYFAALILLPPILGVVTALLLLRRYGRSIE